MNIREQLEGQKNNLVQTKNQRLKSECDKPEYQPPCAGNQVSDKTNTSHPVQETRSVINLSTSLPVLETRLVHRSGTNSTRLRKELHLFCAVTTEVHELWFNLQEVHNLFRSSLLCTDV